MWKFRGRMLYPSETLAVLVGADGANWDRPGQRNRDFTAGPTTAKIEGMAFAIIYSPEAVDHLRSLPKSSQVLVVDEVDEQLVHQPTLPTRKRKLLRPNPIAPWELRVGDIRVFYEVQEEPEPQVIVKAVGIKRHNDLWIGEEKIEL